MVCALVQVRTAEIARSEKAQNQRRNHEEEEITETFFLPSLRLHFLDVVIKILGFVLKLLGMLAEVQQLSLSMQ